MQFRLTVRNVLVVFMRYVPLVSIAMVVGGIAVALVVSLFGLTRYEVLFGWSTWVFLVGFAGVFLSMFGALLIRCAGCGRRALVSPNADGEPGNTIAIFETRACHHCGQKLS